MDDKKVLRKFKEIYKPYQILYLEDTGGLGGVVFCIKNPQLEKIVDNPFFYVFRERGDNGLISPTGELFFLSPESHERIARNVFKAKNKDELIEKGWLSLTWYDEENILFIQGHGECSIHTQYDYFTGDLKFSELTQGQQNTLYNALHTNRFFHV
jgi:hypothetical protein